MDKRFFFLCLFVGMSIIIKAQHLVDKYEYWFNSDYNAAKEVMVTPSSILNISATISTTSLPNGLHTLQTRFRQTDGIWSTTSTQYFMKLMVTENENNLINGYEYWFDNDYAGKVNQTVTSQGDIILVTDINTCELPVGLHSFNIRFRSVEGIWSVATSQFFMKLADTESQNNLLYGYEYWFDNDYAGKVSQTVSPQGDLALVAEIATSEVAVGLHTFNIRFRSVGESWSAVNKQFFLKPEISAFAENKIVAYEYWCNDSVNSKTRVDITPVNPLELDNQLLEISNLTQIASPDSFLFVPDVHGNAKIHYFATNRFSICFLDNTGKWSIPSVHLFTDGKKGVDIIADTLHSGIPVTKMKPADDEIHFYKLNALAGDSLIWKTDQPCTIQVFDPFGVIVYEAKDEENLTFDGVRVKRDGVYHVLLHSVNSYSNHITLDYKHVHKHAVLGSNISKIGNNCIFTLKLTGNGFTSKSTLLLRNDTVEIEPQQIVDYNIGELYASFVFNNIKIGNYDIEVIFDNDIIIVKQDAISVEMSDLEAALSTQIIGNTQYLAGSSNLYTIHISNNSNIPAHNVPLTITIQCEDTTSVKKIKFHQDFMKIEDDILNNLFGHDKEIIDIIKTYFDSDNDLNEFYLIGDSLGNLYLRCDLFIPEIAPNASIDIPFTIYDNRSKIDIYASVPKFWNGLSQSSSLLRSSGKHLCCDDWICIINFALGLIPGFDYKMANEVGKCAAKMYVETYHITIFSELGCAIASENQDEEKERVKNIPQNMMKAMMIQLMHCWFDHLIEKYGKETAKKIMKEIGERGTYFLGVAMNWIETGTDCYISHIGGKGWGQCGGDDEPEHLPSSPVTSFDPNDKTGYRSPSGSTYFKDDVRNMTYIINFENEPEKATAAAHDVYITDTLDMTKFDIHSFRTGYVRVNDKIKHASYDTQNHSWDIDMRPEMNLITRVNLSLDKEKGIARWHFSSIDPMTDKPITDVFGGFLPPNDETGRGQGSVSFSINLKDDLPDNAEISNVAEIVFDYNEPILTPQWINKKDVVAPISSMFEPEIIDESTVNISWRGEDNKNGSGVFRYNLFVKKAGNDYYTPLLEATDQKSINFSYEENIKYQFYVTAVDSAGNIEVKTAIPDIVFTNRKIQDFTVNISRKWDDVLICDNTDNLFTEYKWYKDDVAISGANKQFYQEKGDLNGSYYVQVTTSDGQIGISNVIEASGNTKQVKVYPNPTKERMEYSVEIISSDKDLKNAILQVISINGNIVTKRTGLQQKMRLNGLSSGMYVIWVQFENGESLSQKLLVK